MLGCVATMGDFRQPGRAFWGKKFALAAANIQVSGTSDAPSSLRNADLLKKNPSYLFSIDSFASRSRRESDRKEEWHRRGSQPLTSACRATTWPGHRALVSCQRQAASPGPRLRRCRLSRGSTTLAGCSRCIRAWVGALGLAAPPCADSWLNRSFSTPWCTYSGLRGDWIRQVHSASSNS